MDRTLARRLLQRLARVDRARLRRHRVALLPDFFVDHFVRLPSWGGARRRLDDLAHQKGGFLVPSDQRLLHGGNAANAALALARLGIRVHLLAKTDRVGAAVLRTYAGPVGLDVSRVQVTPRGSLTAALEFGDTATNVLISQPGPADGFGPADLRSPDWRLLERCHAVGVFNWALNRSAGTELARDVFHHVHAAGGLTFFDCADPSPRRADLRDLYRRVLSRTDLRVWALNQNELHQVTSVLVPEASKAAPMAGARALSKLLPARIDLHTRGWAASVHAGEATRVAGVPIARRRRLTGAGDAWNAGDLLGYLLDVEPDERLLLGHAVAAFYVSAPEPRHPDLRDVQSFLRRGLNTGK